MKYEQLYGHQDWTNLAFEFFTAKATNPQYYDELKEVCREQMVREGIHPDWGLLSRNAFQWFLQKRHSITIPTNILDLILSALTDIKALTVVNVDHFPVRLYSPNDNVAKYYYSKKLVLNKIFGFEFIIERYLPSVFKIEVKFPDGDRGIGNGFLTDFDPHKLIITNAHVLRDAESWKVIDYNDQEIDIAGSEFDSANDLAAIFPRSINESVTPFLLSETLKPLKDILTIGYPPVPYTNAAYALFHVGEVNSFVQTYCQRRLFLFSAKTNPGNSGSPIITDDGTVCGIVTEQLEEHEGYKRGRFPYYAGVPAVEIRTFMNRVREGLC